ncbi:MAG: Flp pilus assembly protein CpaB [Vicinamibacterales bacterium]
MTRNTRTILVLLVALATAGVATVLVERVIEQRPPDAPAAPRIGVVVASHPLANGALITPSDVKLVGWPADALVPGSFSKVEDVMNRGLITSVLENEPLTDSKLAAVGAGAGLPPTITPGMRAISVRVNEVVGVAGFVTPGNRVDVFVTLEEKESTVTKVVVSNVQVLAAGTRYEQDKKKNGEAMPSTVVTLLLSPEDAERTVLAATEGQIMLALRNPLDVDPTNSAGTRLTSLFGAPNAPAELPTGRPPAKPRVIAVAPPPPPPPPEPKPYTVEVVRGAKRTEEAIR